MNKAPATSRPNILWICSDQQRFDTIGALGNAHIRTPNIDGLVGDGVAFTHAFCQSPICTPSRSSFLTGLYPSAAHGCMNGNERWGEGAPLVTKLLADDGYDCGLAGKLHLAGASGRLEPRPLDDGYRVFLWSHHPEDDWPEGHAYADWLRSKGYDPKEISHHPESVPVELHQSSWCARMAVEFIEEQREGPWLMSINFFDPHAPFNPPRDYLDHYDPKTLPDPLFRPSDLEAQAKLAGVTFQNPARDPEAFDARQVKAAYYAMIELIDDCVGQMLEALDRTGQRDNTIVIFMSDHGEMLGDHGLLLKGCRFYEGLVRVPLIISAPGLAQKGIISDALVELTDLAPTLLEAAGTPFPDRMQGRSLLPLLTGRSDIHHHRDTVRSEFYRALSPEKRDPGKTSGLSARDVGSRGVLPIGVAYGTMLRDRRYKLVVYHGHDHGELFDLETDPGEFNNLWDDPDYAGLRFELIKRSFDQLALAVDTGPKQTCLY
jgi:arylsulfatase A-like enzyme